MVYPQLQALEARCLLSASLTNVIGQYTATASVTFTPAKAPAPASDNVMLTIGSESARGKLAGTISDSFGQSASVAGSITVKDRAKLHIVTDRKTSDESGSLAFTLSTDETTLTGQWREHDLSTHVSWGGSLSVQRPASSVTPANLVGTYSGTVNGVYYPDADFDNVADPYTAPSSIILSTESADGAVTGSLNGFEDGGNIARFGPATGTITGDTLAMTIPTDVADVSISVNATLNPKTGELSGTFSIQDFTDYFSTYDGSFTFAPSIR
jgi:predicted secreted protein